MSAYVTTTQLVSDSVTAEYSPARVFEYGGGKYQSEAAAHIWVNLGRDVRLALDIEDARALLTGLAKAMCEHKKTIAELDLAEYRVDLLKAVA